MRIKLSPSAVHSGAALASLLCVGKFKVGYFLDSPRISEFSSSEESESKSANDSDNESNISIPGPSHRWIDVTPTTGFSKNDRQPRIPPFIGNLGMQFAVENKADVMSYFDHYIPPELTEIVVDQTNLCAQQQITKMPRPITKHASSEEWKPVTVIEMKKFIGLVFVTVIVQKPKLQLYWSTRGIFQTPIFPQTMSRNRFKLIQRYLHFNDNVSSLSSSSDESQGLSRTPTPTPKKVPQKMTPLAGLMEN